MRRITGIPRQQRVLLPESLDAYISVDRPVWETARRDLCGGCRVTGSPTAMPPDETEGAAF